MDYRSELSSEVLYKSWQRFRKMYRYADDITWEEVTESVFILWKMKDRKKITYRE
ncbi:hypothetical protein J2Z83_001318 [Virgibacillus natechei]|uniref:RNA polymerase sigma-70 region 2 domain-containing protein n=1 Tax=Virgibacillus natechei TaxID=1216297 RepID=A0ABS4IE39_9BACI|nr:hypothetical protein [Virgibacillus natechei]MBP1969214.1 hypothetical protein [Virgibacillus natechei]UZD12378.1 hypothetical protein OLD84_15910 [Virgibacillus natechei]